MLLFLEILFICFVFVYIIVEQKKEKEDYIKSELIGGGSSKYLKQFLKLYINNIKFSPPLHIRSYLVLTAMPSKLISMYSIIIFFTM